MHKAGQERQYGVCLIEPTPFSNGAAGVTLMFSKSRVFVIEADQVIRSALGYILSERHETLTFSETADALTKAATPDIVLVGISILESEGAEVVAVLARKLHHAGIIVVAGSP